MRNKPAYGEPCNQCGQCCMKYPCPFGAFMFEQQLGRCPALEQDGDIFNCGFVTHPERYEPFQTMAHGKDAMRKAALVLIGHGSGCDAQFVGEPINDAYRNARKQEYIDEAKGPRPPSIRFLRAMETWGLVRSLFRTPSV